VVYFTGAVSITTPGNDTRISLTPYGITAENRTSLIFQVQACGPAQIFLLDSETNPTEIRKFAFGNQSNTRCEFADSIYKKFSYSCSNTCHAYDHYWISWSDHHSDGSQDWKMGRGSVIFSSTIGSSPLIGFVFSPNYIEISSTDQPAIWEFSKCIFLY
jgi:hypothetical protein